MSLNFGAFVANLYYMGVGMACIFIVIGVIILSVMLLDRISTSIANRKKAAEEAAAEQNTQNP